MVPDWCYCWRVTTDDELAVGQNLRELREAEGLSQAQLAARMAEEGIEGFYPQTILKLESGKRALKYVEGLALARIFDVEADALLAASPDAIRADRRARQATVEVREAAHGYDLALTRLLIARSNLVQLITDGVFAETASARSIKRAAGALNARSLEMIHDRNEVMAMLDGDRIVHPDDEDGRKVTGYRRIGYNTRGEPVEKGEDDG